jgi:transposase-like protein
LKRIWAEEVRNVSVLVAIVVSEEGNREVLAVAEGAKQGKEGWRKAA